MEPDREANTGKRSTAQGAEVKRKLWGIGVAAFLVLVTVGAISWLRLSEPTFQGKTAKEWFNEIDPTGKPSQDDPAVQACLPWGKPQCHF